MTESIAQQTIDEKSEILAGLSKDIWNNPETAFKEGETCKLLADFLKEEGFEVEVGHAGVPTAIRASWGSGKPVIGFLGEYDALPGMSQKISLKKEPVEEGKPGHACGHNLLGVAHIGAALGMKKEMEEKNLDGTVVFYGCPAEEVLTGKAFMARGGAFRDLDISMAWHPWASNYMTTGTMTGINTAKFHFKGQTAHAGADPHNGRSALDAVEIMNVGANYLREHVTDDVRIHYVITDGGSAPNIVPDRATVWYYVRALSREAVVDTYDRLVKIAKGAAMMMETEVDIEFEGGCYNTLQNKTLVNLVHNTMKEVELPKWTEEELEFAAKLNKNSINYKKLVESGKISKDTHIDNEIHPIEDRDEYGSTDVGDVQHIAPGVMLTSVISNIGTAPHNWQFTVCAGSSIGMKGMIYASKVMADAGIKAIENPEIIKEAKREFKKAMKGKEYECPIPDDILVPGS